MIVKAFADAGFGPPQQLAPWQRDRGVEISILEPFPRARAAVGLFQLNMAGGLGSGTRSQNSRTLRTKPINLILSEAARFGEFKRATSLRMPSASSSATLCVQRIPR